MHTHTHGHVKVLMGKMKEVQVAAVAATKAMEYVFVPVDVPAGEPVQVPMHNDCMACTTHRHMAHTCAKGGSRKRKASVALAEERCRIQSNFSAINQFKMTAEFDSIIAGIMGDKKLPVAITGMDKELPGRPIQLPSIGALMVCLRTMAKK